MSWARVMAPLAGADGDAAVLSAAVRAAEPFGAELSAVFAPADVADIMPWLGEGYMGGVQTTAIETLRQAAATGEARSRASYEACVYGKKTFIALQSPVWASLSAEARLSDLVVFSDDPARGRGPLAECFQQIVADEQRPVLIARDGFEVGGVVAVAWDGGKEASRAARLALPMLERASRVILLAAPRATSRHFDPARLQAYYAARGVQTEVEVLGDKGEAAGLLLGAVRRAGANLLVAGAFGHPRLQEFIFGGTTRSLLAADAPSLFLSH
ncbi:universal stress protein [Phenylobacterium sp.]|jgi:nucleotide-binding universal stress UspA family protein|uniref:universal stress protein n=1 Tax=Phenylobacterium sp. TaxID=1871053 RepID=UPI0025FAE6C9|nr:universal stress protein [Phenylobacterium sp.]MCA3719726.1 universal stress protein [Phenylobacterium sp.]